MPTQSSLTLRGLLPRLTLAVVIAAALVSLTACKQEEEQTRRGQPAAAVTTQLLQPEPWSDELSALGTANARESVTITAPVSQTIATVDFDSGQLVAKGQPLVTLVAGQQAAGVAEAQAELRNAEQLYERNRKLADQQLIARATLETQRAALEAARARVATQRANVADRVIRAPFSGVLGLRLVSPGSLVTPGTPITTLDDVSVIKLDFTVPESALSQVAPGQAIVARSSAWPGEVFNGRIDTVDSRVDAASRALTVRALVPNPDGKLRPGMLLDVGVERATRQALVVPEIAVQQNAAQASVYVVEASGDKVKLVPVKIGLRKQGKVEIVEGLKAGDRIVVDGTVKLRDGAKIQDVNSVKPVPATEAKSEAKPQEAR